MQILISVLFLVIVLLRYKVELTRKYRITPVFALGIPYGIIMLIVTIVDMFSSEYSYKMSVGVPFYSCIYILVFIFIGEVVHLLYFKKTSELKKVNICKEDDKISEIKHEKIYMILTMVFVLYIVIYYIQSFGFSIIDLSTIKLAFANGLPAHLVNFTTGLMLVNFVALLNNKTNSNRKIPYILNILWMVFLIVASTKYSLFIYVFSIIFAYSYIKFNKINLKKIAILSISASSLFILVYAARFISQGFNIKEIPIDFILGHFSFYLTGSFYGYSSIIESGINGSIGFGILFAPVINFISTISGNTLLSTISDFIPVDMGSTYSSTNVFTLFGALQYETSILSTIFLVGLISFFTYYNYYKMVKYEKIFSVPLNSYICGVLVVSFFNCFYGTLNVWEIIATLLVVYYFEKIINKF